MDYKHGKIYRLVCLDTGKQYIGSTTQPLHKRKCVHISHYKRWEEDKSNYISAFEVLKSGNVDIVLIENFPCETKDQLYARERYWIEQMECVNIRIPLRNRKEYYKLNKQQWEAYYTKHKEERSKWASSKIECTCAKLISKSNYAKHRRVCRGSHQIV